MSPLSLEDAELRADVAADTLEQIELISLSANPANIGPFGSSIIHWEVKAPERGYILTLRVRAVSRTGTLLVRPRTTETFRLAAKAGPLTKVLGSVTVNVDLSACSTSEYYDFHHVMDAALRTFVADDPTLSFVPTSVWPHVPGRPEIEFAENRISFRIRLQKSIQDAPNPTVTISANFGFGVADDLIVVRNAQVEVEIKFPWYFRVVGGLTLWRPGEVPLARSEAIAAVHAALDRLAALLPMLLGLRPERRPHTIQVLAADKGTIQLLHCPEVGLQEVS